MPSTRDLLIHARGAIRALGSVAASVPLRLGIFALLSLVATWSLLSHAAVLNDFRDAHVLSHYETAAALAVRGHGELPLWDPYYCGGMYLLGTPQARFVSPTFLFTLLFGESRGAAIAAFAMIIVALEGAFRYARDRRASNAGAILGAPIFGLSGVFAVAPVFGWTNFYGFALLPWMAFGVRRALRGEMTGAAIAAGAVAWCIGFGGTYAVPMAALWCALETVEALAFVVARRPRTPRKLVATLGRAALVASLAVGLSAVRLWPVAETLRDAPRVIGGAPASDFVAIMKMLFAGIIPGDGEIPNDGTYFIGLFAVPAVALACMRRRSIPLVVHAVVWSWLAAGYAAKPSLFAALRGLPVYGTLRYPERFLILLALAASALAATGVTSAMALARTRARGKLAWAIVGVATSAALFVGVTPMLLQYDAAVTHRPLTNPPVTIDRPFHQARGTRWALAYYAPMSRGSLSCWDAYPVPQSPLLRGDLTTEERLIDPAAGTLHERAWAPNQIDLDVDLTRPARVAVNQNWHVGWRASVGEVHSDRGLLVVDLPAGHHALTLRFLPRSAIGGALVSLVSLAAIVLLVVRRRSRTWEPLAASLAPVVAFALAIALIPQARAEPSPLLTPTGEPIVRDAPEKGSVRLGTRFDGGLTLEAVRLREAAPGEQALTLELDWRRDAKITRGLGIFMHIEPSSGTGLNGDHASLSQVLTFDDAPPGKTLRDLVPITLPADAGGKTWKVWVGLWRLQAGDRVHVRDPGGAVVSDDRVLVGTLDIP